MTLWPRGGVSNHFYGHRFRGKYCLPKINNVKDKGRRIGINALIACMNACVVYELHSRNIRGKKLRKYFSSFYWFFIYIVNYNLYIYINIVLVCPSCIRYSYNAVTIIMWTMCNHYRWYPLHKKTIFMSYFNSSHFNGIVGNSSGR